MSKRLLHIPAMDAREGDEVIFGFPNGLHSNDPTSAITEIQWDRHDSTIHITFEDERLNAFYEPCDQFHVRIDVPDKEW